MKLIDKAILEMVSESPGRKDSKTSGICVVSVRPSGHSFAIKHLMLNWRSHSYPHEK